MSRYQLIIGVDPGPQPGVVGLVLHEGAVVQVHTFPSPDEAFSFASVLTRPWVAVERFVVGRGTIRKTRGASMETIAQAQDLAAGVKARGWPLQFLPAGSVKPIVTDARLKSYGLWPYLQDRHQRDAARHAVYMALKHGALKP